MEPLEFSSAVALRSVRSGIGWCMMMTDECDLLTRLLPVRWARGRGHDS